MYIHTHTHTQCNMFSFPLKQTLVTLPPSPRLTLRLLPPFFKQNFTNTSVPPSAQHPHFLSEDAFPKTGWELLFSMNWGESCEASSVMVMPLRASSSRAMRLKAASTFWASLADVSRAASTPLFSARVHASSNNTCLWAWRSDLLPAATSRTGSVYNRSGEDVCVAMTSIKY